MPTVFKIRFLPKAIEELENIYKQISTKLILEIDKAISYIEKDPYIYPMSFINGYRKCPIRNYIVFYKVIEEKKEAHIVHVFHGSQDYARLF